MHRITLAPHIENVYHKEEHTAMVCRRLFPLLLLCLLCCGPVRAWSQARYALLIACGDHQDPSVPRLLAPPHDVRLMAGILNGRCGFPSGNITVLGLRNGEAGPGYAYAAPHATREAIRQALLALSDPRRVRPGDYVVIYVSGHGASNPDPNSRTLTREYLVTYDVPVRDDTLKGWVAAVRGHVTLVLDTCYSGGLIKRADNNGHYDGLEYGFVSKSLPPDVVIPQTLSVDKAPPYAPAMLPFTLLAACGPYERAEELRFHRRDSGSDDMAISGFTWALYYSLIHRSTLPAPGALRRDVENHLQDTQCLQHPVFRLAIDPQALFAPMDAPPNGAAYAWTRVDIGRILMQAGYLAGVRPGMRFAVTTGRKSYEKAPPEAAVVESCDWFESRLRPVMTSR
jgi:hypothetical protein